MFEILDAYKEQEPNMYRWYKRDKTGVLLKAKRVDDGK